MSMRASSAPAWMYNELRQVGVDFENAEQVARYDAKQGSRRASEQDLIARLGIEPEQVVVDLGCGTGSFACEAARMGARVRAVDVSRAMLDFVKAVSDREGLSLQVEHAGFLSFRAPAESVDVIVSRFALHHLPDFWKQVALLRVREALRPGGILYLRDVIFSFDAAGYLEGVNDWVESMPSRSGFSRSEFEVHVREEYSSYSWILEGMLERAGFQIGERSYPAPQYAEYLCSPRIRDQ